MRRVGYKVTSLSVALAKEQIDFILQKGIHIGLSLYSIGISVLIIPVHIPIISQVPYSSGLPRNSRRTVDSSGVLS